METADTKQILNNTVLFIYYIYIKLYSFLI